MRIPRPKSKLGTATALAAVPVVLLLGSTVTYKARGEKICEACHEIAPSVATWRGSSHASIACTDCHDDAVTLDPSIHAANLGSLARHLRGQAPERILVTDAVLDRMIDRCRSCHRQEAADWEAGPHGKSFTTFFLNEARNRDELLIDDCLRCHGAHFAGGIDALVGPIDRKGPWRFVREDMASRPAIPCIACHRIHGPRDPEAAAWRSPGEAPPELPADAVAPRQPAFRSTLARFDRRSKMSVAAGRLPHPEVFDGDRPVLRSADPRHALCMQCHAPDATGKLGSGTDRTPAGVHEGLSCLACHQKHDQRSRASCADCHPRLSNCGIAVEEMDTTFRSRSSKHDIHTVKCADCHPGGAPERKPR